MSKIKIIIITIFSSVYCVPVYVGDFQESGVCGILIPKGPRAQKIEFYWKVSLRAHLPPLDKTQRPLTLYSLGQDDTETLDMVDCFFFCASKMAFRTFSPRNDFLVATTHEKKDVIVSELSIVKMPTLRIDNKESVQTALNIELTSEQAARLKSNAELGYLISIICDLELVPKEKLNKILEAIMATALSATNIRDTAQNLFYVRSYFQALKLQRALSKTSHDPVESIAKNGNLINVEIKVGLGLECALDRDLFSDRELLQTPVFKLHNMKFKFKNSILTPSEKGQLKRLREQFSCLETVEDEYIIYVIKLIINGELTFGIFSQIHEKLLTTDMSQTQQAITLFKIAQWITESELKKDMPLTIEMEKEQTNLERLKKLIEIIEANPECIESILQGTHYIKFASCLPLLELFQAFPNLNLCGKFLPPFLGAFNVGFAFNTSLLEPGLSEREIQIIGEIQARFNFGPNPNPKLIVEAIIFDEIAVYSPTIERAIQLLTTEMYRQQIITEGVVVKQVSDTEYRASFNRNGFEKKATITKAIYTGVLAMQSSHELFRVLIHMLTKYPELAPVKGTSTYIDLKSISIREILLRVYADMDREFMALPQKLCREFGKFYLHSLTDERCPPLTIPVGLNFGMPIQADSFSNMQQVEDLFVIPRRRTLTDKEHKIIQEICGKYKLDPGLGSAPVIVFETILYGTENMFLVQELRRYLLSANVSGNNFTYMTRTQVLSKFTQMLICEKQIAAIGDGEQMELKQEIEDLQLLFQVIKDKINPDGTTEDFVTEIDYDDGDTNEYRLTLAKRFRDLGHSKLAVQVKDGKFILDLAKQGRFPSRSINVEYKGTSDEASLINGLNVIGCKGELGFAKLEDLQKLHDASVHSYIEWDKVYIWLSQNDRLSVAYKADSDVKMNALRALELLKLVDGTDTTATIANFEELEFLSRAKFIDSKGGHETFVWNALRYKNIYAYGIFKSISLWHQVSQYNLWTGPVMTFRFFLRIGAWSEDFRSKSSIMQGFLAFLTPFTMIAGLLMGVGSFIFYLFAYGSLFIVCPVYTFISIWAN